MTHQSNTSLLGGGVQTLYGLHSATHKGIALLEFEIPPVSEVLLTRPRMPARVPCV